MPNALKELITIISPIMLFIFGIIFSIIGNMIKRAIIDKLDSLEKAFMDFKEEVLRDYITKNEYNKNETAHEKIWIEVNSARERIAKLEK